MNNHTKTVAIVRIILGVPGIFASAVVFLAIAGGGILSADPTAIFVTSTVGFVISTLLLLIHLPGLIGGIFLLRGHEWARSLLLIVSCLSLIDFPFGTALGAYSIWALTQSEHTPVSAAGFVTA